VLFKHLRQNFALRLAAMLVAMCLLPLLGYYIASNRATEEAMLDMAAGQQKSTLSNQHAYLKLQIEQIEALAANLVQVEEIAKSLHAANSERSLSSFDALATQARIGYLLSNYRNMKGLVSIDLFSLGGKHYRVGDSLTAVDERSGLRDQLLAATTKSKRIRGVARCARQRAAPLQHPKSGGSHQVGDAGQLVLADCRARGDVADQLFN
jgi:two-component system sensor histidine kinase/response regulator